MEFLKKIFGNPVVTWILKVGRDSAISYGVLVANGSTHASALGLVAAVLSGFAHALEGK